MGMLRSAAIKARIELDRREARSASLEKFLLCLLYRDPTLELVRLRDANHFWCKVWVEAATISRAAYKPGHLLLKSVDILERVFQTQER